MNHFEETQERLIRYAKINTRSDDKSDTIPSTQIQWNLLKLLEEELQEIGMDEVYLNPETAFLTATLPSNQDEEVPVIGFIAHVDTADFNSEGVNPQVWPDYQGQDLVLNADQGIVMKVEDFPNLKNYLNQTLITTDGMTLLGADDKAGVAEIVTAMEYLINHPEIPHGKVRVAFGPDEEIGRGADNFDVDHFGANFAYTIDGGPVGELQYESFNAAEAQLSVSGINIHPGTAKGKMVNAITVLNDFMTLFDQGQTPEATEGRQGFYHWTEISGTVEEAYLSLIIRDHDRQLFNERKEFIHEAVKQINHKYPTQPISLKLSDQYYNMAEIIRGDMTSVELAHQAMINLGIEPVVEPIRGGTDGSKISFMGLPTPNIFAGGENMHGRYEYIAVESMVRATEVIIEICRLSAQA